MSGTSKTSRKKESIRWTIDRAADEFDIDNRTLTKALTRAGLLAGEDGRWSTSQMVQALFGDHEAEQLRKTREEADKLALANKKTRGELVELDVVGLVWDDIVTRCKSRIMLMPGKLSSRLGLPDAHKKEIEREVDDVLTELATPTQYQSGGNQAEDS
jgi:phage terminase Nu1 subunit (DNA packaging protein)